MELRECESCAEVGIHNIPAIGHCQNPDYSGYWLCAECITEYDSRPYENLSGDPSEAADVS